MLLVNHEGLSNHALDNFDIKEPLLANWLDLGDKTYWGQTGS